VLTPEDQAFLAEGALAVLNETLAEVDALPAASHLPAGDAPRMA